MIYLLDSYSNGSGGAILRPGDGSSFGKLPSTVLRVNKTGRMTVLIGWSGIRMVLGSKAGLHRAVHELVATLAGIRMACGSRSEIGDLESENRRLRKTASRSSRLQRPKGRRRGPALAEAWAGRPNQKTRAKGRR